MYQVLIVDDEKIIRIGLRTLINWESYGFKVAEVVSDGKQALEVIERESIDLVLTDIKMPNMDGIELVKRLNERSFNGEMIMLTSYGEFELARECLRYGVHDYLLKGTLVPEDLVRAVQAAREKLEQRVPHSLINAQEEKVVNKEDLVLIERAFKSTIAQQPIADVICTLSKPYTFLLFKHIQSKAQKEKNKDKTLVSYRISIENIVAEVLSKQDNTTLLFEGEYCLYIIPENIEKSREEVRRVSLQIQSLIKLYTNIKIIGVISRCIYTSKDLSESLERIKKVTELAFYKGYEDILEEEMFSLMKPCTGESPIVLEEKLHQEIKKGEYTQANVYFDEYIGEMKKGCIPQKEVDNRLNHILQSLILEYSIYLENEKIKLSELVEQYRKSTLLEEMQNVINELISMICMVLVQIKNKHYRKEIIEIMAYIDEHIGEKITLTSIASQINMNESYISRLFKNETGINIIHYINVCKMEKAKELLKEKNMIVKDVAYALGFEEQSYFNRMFNKYFGINPKDYKKCTKISQ